MPVLVGDLTIGLRMLIAQILMQLGMFFGAQALLVRVPVGLVELIMNVGVLLIEPVVLSLMAIRRMGKRRERRGECHRTDRREK